MFTAILFPYTTLFRSKPEMDALLAAAQGASLQQRRDHAVLLFLYNTGARADEAAQVTIADLERSEEHTSELQSPCNLVCRLLLEKKNNHTFINCKTVY